jgi:hypothetical protein
MPLGVRVQRLRGDVGFVGPDNRARLRIGTKLTKVLQVPEGLEDATVVEQVREIDVSRQAVLKTDMNVVTVGGGGIDQEGQILLSQNKAWKCRN